LSKKTKPEERTSNYQDSSGRKKRKEGKKIKIKM